MAKLPRHQIAKVLAERTIGMSNAKDLSEHVAAYLLAEGRTSELEPLLRDIMSYRAEHGIVEVTAVSAHALTAASRKDVERQVASLYPNAKSIIVSEDVQPAMLGGVRLEFPNEQLDLTARAQLNRLKQLTTTRR